MTRAGAGGADIARKRAMILDYETAYARALAARVIDRPALSVWMILLPVLLVHFFHRRQVFETSCAAFAEHFLTPRRRALAIAAGDAVAAEEGNVEGSPPAGRMARADADQIEVLAGHYRRLLSAEGHDYRALVVAGYASVSEYRRHLDRLEEAHDAIDAAVLAGAGEREDIRETVRRVRSIRRSMDRDEAARLFD